MRLSSLRLVNYRRYRDASVEFPDGLIGIVGRNGAGKSSLLEAIMWSLFGHDAARTSKELLKRQDAAPGEDVLVRLEFESEGQGFAVTRRLRGKSLQPEACVESAGQMLVSPGPHSWDQANRCLERLLGFDRASFEATVVAKQGELAALSDLRPAQRKRLLLDMLGVERIEVAIQQCRSEARLLDARLTEARRALEAEPEMHARLAEAARQLSEAQAQLAQTVTRREAALVRAQEERVRAERFLEARLRDQELRVRLQGLQSRLESIWTQRTRLAAEATLLRERQAEASRLRQQLQGFEDLDGQLHAWEAAQRGVQERARLARRLEVLSREELRWRPLLDAKAENGSSPEHLEKRLSEFDSLAQAAVQEFSRLEVERVRYEHELEQLEAAPQSGHAHELRPEDDCPVCERPLGESLETLRARQAQEAAARAARKEALHGVLTRVRGELHQVEARRRSGQVEAEAVRVQLEAARQRVRDAELASQEVARLGLERKELQAQMEALPAPMDAAAAELLVSRRRERDALRDQTVRAEEGARRLPRLLDEDRVLQAEESRIVEERERCSRDLHQLAYPAGAWEKARSVSEQAQRELESLERDQVQWRERAAGWEREVAGLRERTLALEATRQRVNADLDRLKVLETIAASRGDAGLLPEFKAHLVGRIRPALARSAATLVRQMTGGRYSELVLDDEYGVHVYDGAVAHPMERFSGGERDVTNLGLRLAVSELVANARGRSRLQFVALDEVFGSQDTQRREAVMQCLGGLSNVFRQVLVVTHLDDVRDRLDHVLRVDEDEDGSSRIALAA